MWLRKYKTGYYSSSHRTLNGNIHWIYNHDKLIHDRCVKVFMLIKTWANWPYTDLYYLPPNWMTIRWTLLILSRLCSPSYLSPIILNIWSIILLLPKLHYITTIHMADYTSIYTTVPSTYPTLVFLTLYWPALLILWLTEYFLIYTTCALIFWLDAHLYYFLHSFVHILRSFLSS